jgi:hypothetical protein
MPLVDDEQVGIVGPVALNRIAPAPAAIEAPVCNVLYEFLKLVRPIALPAVVPFHTQLAQPVQLTSMVDCERPSAVPSAAEMESTLLLVTLIFVCVT